MRTHDISIRDFLVYVEEQGVYINVLFAERHKIRKGSSIEPSMMELHKRTIPEMDSDSSDIWLNDEQKAKQNEKYKLGGIY